MNNDALNEFVKFMTETLKQAKDFTVAQAPDVLKEIIHFSLAQAVAGILLAIVLIVGSYGVHRWIQNTEQCGEFYIPVVISSLVGFLLLCGNVVDLLQITLAPRMYLIEYFAHLVAHK